MKKLAIILVIIFASCSKQETAIEIETANEAQLNYYDKGYIESAPLSEQLEYKRYHMKKITKWLLNNDIHVYNYLSEKLQRNTALEIFYVTNIVNSLKNNKSTSTTEKQFEDLENSLNAFENLDGDTAYPYIHLLNNAKYLSRAPYDDSKPLYALEDFDENNNEELAKGYQENENGELVEINETITPALAGEEDIIVMELGPCGGTVNDDPITDRSPCGGSGGGGGGGTNSGRLVRFDNMKIKDLKEGYPFRSEIHIKAFKEVPNPITNGDCGQPVHSSVNCYDYDGRGIITWKRRWQNETKDLNDWIIAVENVNSTDVVFYTIFEHDSFPAPRNFPVLDGNNFAGFIFPNGTQRIFEYRSWQSQYHSVILSLDQNNNFNIPYTQGYNKNNGDITYRLH